MVDFSKDLQTEGGSHVRFIAELGAFHDYPFIVVIDHDGERVDQANEHGETRSGLYIVTNKPEPPKVVYARLFKDETGAFYFDENAYDSEAEAKDAGDRYQLVGIVPVTVPDADAPVALAKVTIGCTDYHVGDKVETYRARHGRRLGVVKKIRDDATSALFVQHDDGSKPYWVLNRSVRRNLGAADDAAAAPNDGLDTTAIDGVVFSVGERIHFSSRHRGAGYATIQKIRADDMRSLFIQPESGATPFWALNSSIRPALA